VKQAPQTVAPPRPWLAWAPHIVEEPEAQEDDGQGGFAPAAVSAAPSPSPSATAATAAGAAAPPACLGMRGRLTRLAALPWRRFDVTWPAWRPGFAHNSIFLAGPGGPVGAAVADAVADVLLLPSELE
jgi:hypothetical protein